MSWGAVRRQTNFLPTLRPHYSLLQAEVNARLTAILLARFLTKVRSFTRSSPTQCLEQTLPQFRLTAAAAGVYLIITPVLLSRMKLSASARFQDKICVGAALRQLVRCPGRSPLARAVSKRQKSTQDFFLSPPTFNRIRKTIRICKFPSLRAALNPTGDIWPHSKVQRPQKSPVRCAIRCILFQKTRTTSVLIQNFRSQHTSMKLSKRVLISCLFNNTCQLLIKNASQAS